MLRTARATLRAAGHDFRGLAHITGGGLAANVPRAMPDDLAARLDPAAWRTPSVVRLVAALGGLDDAELRATFNAGIGMVAIVAPEAVEAAVEAFRAAGTDAIAIGEVLPADGALATSRARSGRAGDHGAGRKARGGSRSRSRGRARTSGRCMRPPAGASSAVRSSSCWPTGSVPPSTGRRSRGSRPRSCRAATTAPSPKRSAVRDPTSWSWPGYMRILGLRVLEAFPVGSSTPIRGCCPPSPVPTPSAPRWPRGEGDRGDGPPRR